MYLNLGQNTIILKNSIIGIFDMDTSTVSKKTRDYLSVKEKQKKIIVAGYDLPKSFVVCMEDGEEVVYLSLLSPATLIKRYYDNEV